MALDPALPPAAQIELWRQKVRDETMSTEELREAIRLIREGRMTAGAKKSRPAGAGRAGKASGDASAGETAEELLKDLEGL